MYEVVKTIHVGAVVFSFFGFFIRGVWLFRESPILNQKWVKIIPHGIDTILLASAFWLAVQLKQYPFLHDWLTAKVVGLLFYIGLGMAALHWAKARITQIYFWAGALMAFIYIASVAMTKKPIPFW